MLQMSLHYAGKEPVGSSGPHDQQERMEALTMHLIVGKGKPDSGPSGPTASGFSSSASRPFSEYGPIHLGTILTAFAQKEK